MTTVEASDNFSDEDIDSSRRKLPLNKWIIAGIAVIALVIVGFIVYWFGFRDSGDSDLIFSRGRSLELFLTTPEIVESVVFKDLSGQLRVIRPRATNRQLAVVDTIVVNRTSLVTPLLVDSDAARLGNRRGERINALDPFAASKLAETVTPEEVDKYAPFLWGEIELDRNFQVQGWMVFDVPKGLVLGTFWWDEVDLVIGDYIDYRRR